MIPLADQIAEVAREIRQRDRVYPKWIADGRLKQETADTKLAQLHAALSTLQFIERHADGLRLLVKFLREADLQPKEQPSEEERQHLLAHPAVRAVVDAFPDASISISNARRPQQGPGEMFHNEGEPA